MASSTLSTPNRVPRLRPYVVRADAEISECGRYRYRLLREWEEEGPTVAWIMLNPSIADAEIDDPTQRRVCEFSRSWGFARAVTVNLFAIRSPSPKTLREVDDPVGPENDAAIKRALAEASLVVAAWGAHGDYLRRSRDVRILLTAAVVATGVDVACLGRTRSGEPRHPLYLRSDTLREVYL